IDQCIQDDVLKIFLQKHREAVIMYSRLAYDEEAHEAAIREDSFEDGIKQGIKVFVEDKLEDKVPVDIIREKLIRLFALKPEEAEKYLQSGSEVRYIDDVEENCRNNIVV
ncbi:MAG: hypothetical protein IJT16_04770, partial [Lachnospiraceae bacterium]|nr:hypothetical protein [Lachnospiraceae bacterium]